MGGSGKVFQTPPSRGKGLGLAESAVSVLGKPQGGRTRLRGYVTFTRNYACIERFQVTPRSRENRLSTILVYTKMKGDIGMVN